MIDRWLWQDKDYDNSIDFFTSETIDLIDADKADYTYVDPEGVAVIMPCIDKKEGLKTAKILVERAGMSCKIIISFDSIGKGFIKTINAVANRINVKYIIYLAQDAFPGKYWLKMAYTQLEKDGKGLLGFNDSKWYGVIASFGMVRVSWIHEIYDNAILYPEYYSHGADNELTVIARATDQYIYNPNIVLVEVDHNKGMISGGNPKDVSLFRNRFIKGFDGRVPITNLKKIATDYNIHDMQDNQIRDEEARIGDRAKHDVLNQIHKELKPEIYFEIGVQTGKSLILARNKAIGVDPNPQLTFELPDDTEVIPLTSDEFFEKGADKWLNKSPDLTFIDGMHWVEYALRDFINTEKLASLYSIIVIDDILPAHPAQAKRKRRTRAWAGDIWKLWEILQKYRPELFLLPINASPTGLLLIGGLDPNNNVLEKKYNELIDKYSSDIVPPQQVLNREGVVSGRSNMINKVLKIMRSARIEEYSREIISEKLNIQVAKGDFTPRR